MRLPLACAACCFQVDAAFGKLRQELIGFALFVTAHNSGIGAVHNDLWRLGRQAVFRSERIHIVDVEVAAADDGTLRVIGPV